MGKSSSAAARFLSRLSPLTHLVDAARRVMIDGAGVTEVIPEVLLLTGLALAFLGLAAWLFRWE